MSAQGEAKSSDREGSRNPGIAGIPGIAAQRDHKPQRGDPNRLPWNRSIPHIALVNLYRVSSTDFPEFIQKSHPLVMLFLVGDVLFHLGNV